MSELRVELAAEGFSAAEIFGLDPQIHVASESAGRCIRNTVASAGVACIRLPRALSDEELQAVAAMVGPIKDPIGRTADGTPFTYDERRQIIDSGFVLTEELRKQLGGLSFGGDDLRPSLFEYFHTDDSYTHEPASCTVLHARELPPSGGGDTRFIDMRAAFESLSDEMKTKILRLRAVHRYNNGHAFPPRPAANGPCEVLAEVAHPVVRKHSQVGSLALYFDLDRASHIAGMDIDEGRALLQSLQDHAEETAPRYAHRWQVNDLLIWDNASVQHRGSGDFPVGEPRLFWRYMIAGEVPVGVDADV